jgi:predicted XRE-type DNA-binding protein
MKSMKIKNAFTAFGLDADEATIDTLRTDIAVALRQFIEQNSIDQTTAGRKLGLSQSIISHIVRGEIEHLSVERLIKAMVRAKLPGYAEWGESAEDARAGSIYQPKLPYTPVIQTATGRYNISLSPWPDTAAPETRVSSGSSIASSGWAGTSEGSADGG